jgi:hypothetical protein
VEQPAAIAVVDAEAVVLVVMRRAAGGPTVAVPHYAFQSSKKVGHGADRPNLDEIH